jgi:hypothetical protein
MFSVTWVVFGNLRVVTSPNEMCAWDVYVALKNNGECVRMWNPDKSLYKLSR